MPDQSVVEELLEKGARARCAQSDEEWTGRWPERFRAEAAEILDAMFPGWREGITRGWGVDDSLNEFVLSFSDRESAEFHIGMNGGHGDLVSRWVGPWVPVEERTDG